MARLATRRTIRLEPEGGRRFIPVAEELIDLYGPLVGHRGLAAWLVLRLAAERGRAVVGEDPAEFVAQAVGLTPLEGAEALRQLALYELVEVRGNGEMLVREPLPRADFERRFGKAAVAAAQGSAGHRPDAGGELAAARDAAPPASPLEPARAEVAAAGETGEPGGREAQGRANAGGGTEVAPGDGPGPGPAGTQPGRTELPRDVRSVLEWYHQRIGLISESQFQRLCEWISVRGMTADVVALAIEETARSAQYASFSYLEGVLRNWYNHGVRTWDDLQRRRFLSQMLASRAASPAPGATSPPQSRTQAGEPARDSGPDAAMAGVPNAEAYRPVDPERVKRWKELYAHGH